MGRRMTSDTTTTRLVVRREPEIFTPITEGQKRWWADWVVGFVRNSGSLKTSIVISAKELEDLFLPADRAADEHHNRTIEQLIKAIPTNAYVLYRRPETGEWMPNSHQELRDYLRDYLRDIPDGSAE